MSETPDTSGAANLVAWLFVLGLLLLGGGCYLVSPATALIVVGSILTGMCLWRFLRCG